MRSDAVLTGQSENIRAAGFMVLAMAGFCFNDALVKSVSGELPLFQAIFVRGMFASVLIGMMAWRRGALGARPANRDWRLIGWRCAAEIGGTLTFLTALFHMPFADATAILQSVPLAVTLGAALAFGEPVGWRRYLAITIGFLGVLIIVRPGTEGFDRSALWAVAAVGFVALQDLSIRRMSATVPSLGIVFMTSSAITLTAAILCIVTREWEPITPALVLRLGFAGVFLLVGYKYSVEAMRQGEIGFVQPFRYSLLIWAIILGLVVFGERPDVWMLTGSAIVVATGLFTFYRERRLATLR